MNGQTILFFVLLMEVARGHTRRIKVEATADANNYVISGYALFFALL